MKEDNYLLELNNISKTFPGVKALDDVTLKVRAGKVHALMGENGAGKSTLMKCLFGIYTQDSGEILLDGQEVVTNNSKEALNLGIAMIHQEIHPVKFRNVMENMWLGRLPMHGIGPFKLVDEKKMYKDTQELFKSLGLDVNPNTIVGNLSVSIVQQMEIAKAVSYNAKVIIMDEPTSSLSETEVDHLFRIIRGLQKTGVAIIYISHKMEEILKISDEVSIMRDGKMMGTWDAKDLTTDMIIKKMVGRDLTNRFPDRNNVPGEEVLRIEGFTSPYLRSFKGVSFNLRKGEILGVGGLVGAQRTEVMEAIFGLRSLESGKIFRNDKQVTIKSPIEAKKYSMALITEERRATGIFPVLSVLENIVVANQWKYLNKVGILNDSKRREDSLKSMKQLNIKTPSFKELIQNLSGGNQQKVLLARWLLTAPDILILDEPTRGIDVGAKFEIYTIITELANQGKSIIMISSELPELLGMSDRIMVMCEGHLSGIVDGKTATEENVMALASKYME
ncbi:sugar ABC transporter ATP-binding protein [Clostridium sp.]|uniref:sugar ABC transporter ATP-binding protein n=1 Tax=Clostridium sp. TaxID=1506 RepID=UPI003D6C940D